MARNAGKKNGGGLGRTGNPRSGKKPPNNLMLGNGKSGGGKRKTAGKGTRPSKRQNGKK